mgnify:CR=1 FL=1
MRKHDWKTDPQDRINRIYEEVTEAAKALRLGEGKYAVGEELYDIIWNCAELANQLGIDLERSAQSKEAKLRERTWSNCPCAICQAAEDTE